MTYNSSKHLVVVGGGAAGFFAAIRAKECNPKLTVTILDSAPLCLGKVKVSGGGRCNVTHACFDVARLVEHYPRGKKELRGVFSRFGPADTVAWFQRHGVPLKTETDGRMFPVTDSSQTVIDCLVSTAQGHGIKIRTKTTVKAIQAMQPGFDVVTSAQTIRAAAVVLATGSSRQGYTLAESLGHSLVAPVPSLFTFAIDDDNLTALTGTTLENVNVRCHINGLKKPLSESGPLLITHQGLSGPVILKLSAWGARVLHEANYQASVSIDAYPKLSASDVIDVFNHHKAQHPNQFIGTTSPLTELTKRFWQWVLGHYDLLPEQPWQQLSQKAVRQLSEGIKQIRLPIAGINRHQAEFVTAGGIPLNEIDMRTMESKRCPGLYLAGEVINVDAITGGFNFQNAWSTGWIAGGRT